MEPTSKEGKVIFKAVYSPHDIARICQRDVDEVQSWFDDGRIDFFRTTGGHCRVKHEVLRDFFRENNVGIDLPRNFEEGKYRVLLVEDDRDLLEILAELLSDEPRLEVKMVQDGFSAGLLVESWRPDVILLDFLMPGVSGFEVCKKIRANRNTRDIPVMALTSLSTVKSRQEVIDAGVSDFMGKPFHSETLLAKVRALIGIE